MDIATLRDFLGWSTILNWALMLLWWVFVAFGGDWMYRLHARWFEKLSRESFDAVHYAGLALFKMLVIVFNLVPYLVLRLFF